MSRITSKEFNSFFKGLYNRNKNFLIASAALYFSSLLVGILASYLLPVTIKSFLINIVKTDRTFVSKNGITTFSIFTHNLYSVFLTFAGGIVGIITAAILFFNGFKFSVIYKIHC